MPWHLALVLYSRIKLREPRQAHKPVGAFVSAQTYPTFGRSSPAGGIRTSANEHAQDDG